MDPRLLDVLHDARHDDRLAVTHRVDVNLGGIFQKPIDQGVADNTKAINERLNEVYLP